MFLNKNKSFSHNYFAIAYKTLDNIKIDIITLTFK